MKLAGHRYPMVLAALWLCAGCAFNSPSPRPAYSAARNYDDRLRRICGQPVRYPISPQCIELLASVGPLLKKRGELVLATWRSCPAENPCQRIIDHDPACAGSPDPSRPDGTCERAQEADYSCAALLQSRVYLLSQSNEAAPQCQQAKTDLGKFDREVDRVRLQIQWYQSLTGQSD